MAEQTGTITGRSGRHTLAFIFITILIDSIGIGIIAPILPKLVSTLARTGLDQAAGINAWLAFAYAGMQFLFAPLLGSLSDRFGRRPVLILALVGICIDYAIMGFAPSIGWLFVGRVLAGMAGASFTTAAAYIADVTPSEKRAQNFGLIGAGFGVGFVLGPALGGLIGEYGVRLPFFASAGLAAANALYGLFVLKESLLRENRRHFQIWRANPLGALLALRRFSMVLPLCGVLVLLRLAHDANPAVWSFFTMLKFHWTPAQVGVSLMAIGAIVTAAYMLLPRLIPRLGETRSVYIGLTGGIAAFTGYAFAGQSWMMYAFMLPFALVALVMPSISAIMSKEVGPAEQGELQGATTSVGSLTSVGALLLMGHLFSYFSSQRAPVYFPGAAFTAAALCLVLAGIAFTVINYRKQASAPSQSAQ